MINHIIGTNAENLLWWQMCIRAILIFSYALFLVRLGSTRVFGKSTSFDIVLAVILGSILSRALTGNARFFPTIAASTVLVSLHYVLSKLALRSKRFGHLIKGVEIQLIENGRILLDALKKADMTEHDLKEALRSNGGTDDVRNVKAAYLERSGTLSVLKE